jgi:hypothetical protein
MPVFRSATTAQVDQTIKRTTCIPCSVTTFVKFKQKEQPVFRGKCNTFIQVIKQHIKSLLWEEGAVNATTQQDAKY